MPLFSKSRKKKLAKKEDFASMVHYSALNPKLYSLSASLRPMP